MKLYEPLYTDSRGHVGFFCLVPRLKTGKVCGYFVKTESAILRHLREHHQLDPQLDLPLTPVKQGS